ncbi:MAG: hypothetical protein QNJ72_31355 [Pleurocapsa sp. MO_226.B13]|nr:hypothetical protein [Pleurocapsa sp. MO_226.B13]
MFESIQQLLTSAHYKPRLDRVIDNTHAFLIDPDKETHFKNHNQMPDKEVLGQFQIFDSYSPYIEADSFDVLQFKLKRNMTIGSLTATGGEVPTTSMGELISVQGGMGKITLSHVFDEETMKMMYQFRQSKAIPDTFVDFLFGTVRDLETKVFKLGNLLTAQVWSTGKIRFTDPRTNVSISVDYDTYPELFPDPLTGAATWDNHDTANGIENLIDHSRAFYRINGYYPEAYTMSEENITNLIRQRSTAEYAASMGLINSHPTSNLPTRVTRKILDRMSEEIMALPKIIQFDAQYELEIEPGRSMRFPYNPSHTVSIVNPKSVERVWGLTLESAMGRRNGFGTRRANKMKPKGGIFVYSDELMQLSPPQCRSLAAGRMLPWVTDNRRIGALKVLAG